MAGLKTSVKIEGLDALRRALRMLPAEIQKNELAKATRKGAQVTQKAAKAKAPTLQKPDPRRKAGTLKKAIRATAGKRMGSVGTAFVYIRMLSKKAIAKFKAGQRALGKRIKGSDNPDDPFYWGVLEFSSSSKKARPFMRPAFEQTKVDAANKIKDALREGIEKQAAKIAGRKLF